MTTGRDDGVGPVALHDKFPPREHELPPPSVNALTGITTGPAL
jgi:hypothetical protein